MLGPREALVGIQLLEPSAEVGAKREERFLDTFDLFLKVLEGAALAMAK